VEPRIAYCKWCKAVLPYDAFILREHYTFYCVGFVPMENLDLAVESAILNGEKYQREKNEDF